MKTVKAKKANSDLSPKFLGLFIFCTVYLFFRARGAFSLDPGASLNLFLPYIALFLLFPVIVHITLRRGGPGRGSRIAFWAGYSWMGFMLLFLFVTTSIDIVTLCIGSASALAGSVPEFAQASRLEIFILSLFLSVLLSIYALWEAAFPRVKRVVIITEKLPQGVDSLRITQISDVHLGAVVGRRRASRIARKVGELRPHIFVSTGDLIDARPEYLTAMEEIFKNVDAPLGKFAVVGNHEVSAGLSGSLEFLKNTGFRVLRNETAVLENGMRITGVDDSATGEKNPVLKNCPSSGEGEKEPFTLFLKHRPPAGRDEDDVPFDLQLSGHTHGGQLFPFRYVTLGYYTRLKGLYRLKKGKLLYVSAGTGTWGPPMRFLTPPEVTVIDLHRTHSDAS